MTALGPLGTGVEPVGNQSRNQSAGYWFPRLSTVLSCGNQYTVSSALEARP